MKIKIFIMLFVLLTVFTVNPSYSETENFEDEMEYCSFEELENKDFLPGFLTIGVELFLTAKLSLEFFTYYMNISRFSTGEYIISPAFFRKKFKRLYDDVLYMVNKLNEKRAHLSEINLKQSYTTLEKANIVLMENKMNKELSQTLYESNSLKSKTLADAEKATKRLVKEAEENLKKAEDALKKYGKGRRYTKYLKLSLAALIFIDLIDKGSKIQNNKNPELITLPLTVYDWTVNMINNSKVENEEKKK